MHRVVPTTRIKDIHTQVQKLVLEILLQEIKNSPEEAEVQYQEHEYRIVWITSLRAGQGYLQLYSAKAQSPKPCQERTEQE